MSAATLEANTEVPALNDDGHYEVVAGQRVTTPRMGSYESDLANELAFWLNDFFIAHKKRLGRTAIEVLFRIDLATNLQRRPDLAYISYNRWPKGRRPEPNDAWNVVPDIAVEVVSQSNTAAEIQAKIQDYFRCGVQIVWVVYPTQEQIYVYTSPTQIQVLQKADTLDAGNVIPGFQLPLKQLFCTEP